MKVLIAILVLLFFMSTQAYSQIEYSEEQQQIIEQRKGEGTLARQTHNPVTDHSYLVTAASPPISYLQHCAVPCLRVHLGCFASNTILYASGYRCSRRRQQQYHQDHRVCSSREQPLL